MSARPFHGSVQASGFVFDEALLGRVRVVERVLALWTDGARLSREGERWFLVGLRARRVDTREAPGLPVVWVEGRWLTAALPPAELADVPRDALVDVVGGALHTVPLSGPGAPAAVHPSTLLALPAPRVLVATTLEPPPRPLTSPAKTPQQQSLDDLFAPLLEQLAAQGRPPEPPPPPPEPPRPGLRDRLAAWWRARRDTPALPPGGDAAPPRPGWAQRLGAWLRGDGQPTQPQRRNQPAPTRAPSWAQRLSAWLRGDGAQRQLPPGGDAPARTNAPARDDAPPPRPAVVPVAPARRGWLSRFADWLSPPPSLAPRRTERVALPPVPPRVPPVAPAAPGVEGAGFFAGFLRWFRGDGEAAARPPPPQPPNRYFDELRRAFEENLGEALRRAVPLSNGRGGFTGVANGITPFRRDSLSLLTPPSRGGPAVVMPDGEFEAMRKFYRETADALIAKGQIDEAAFVLAKLLNDPTAAVALLEKHGRFELAAQVATAQHLSETERIRLWLLAGRTEEAIRLVRASQDFEALITALTPRSAEVAQRLRSIWGDYLAQRHRYAEALLATAALDEPPAQWETWRDHALQTGGAAAVTAVATDLNRHPEHVGDARAHLREAIEHERALLPVAAQALLKHAPRTTGPIHRDLWRELMREASEGRPVDRTLVQEVLKSTNDGVLVADAVPNAAPRPPQERQPLEVPAPVASQLRVFDVAPLPKGRRAVALGAAGLKIVSPTGQTLRHHLVKADALVVGPLGARVLVLSLDGALTRVWRLDPLQFGLDSWFQGTIDAFSRRYDGLCWAVGMERALVLLDPATPGPMEWWRVPQFQARDLDAHGRFVSALGNELAQNESRRIVFEVGAQKLEKRFDPSEFAWWRSGELVTWSFKVRDDARLQLTFKVYARSGVSASLRERVVDASGWQQLPMDRGLVLSRTANGNTEVWVVDWSPSVIASFASEAPLHLLARLWGTRQVTLRELAPNRLGITDEHGRVTEVEL